jgi:serine/threonine protein kinase
MLGKGSYGTVYYGTHIKTNQPVAIKSIDRKLIVKDVKSQIDLETNIMKQLNHPNII